VTGESELGDPIGDFTDGEALGDTEVLLDHAQYALYTATHCTCWHHTSVVTDEME